LVEGGAWVLLQAEFAMRGLAPALTAVAFLVFEHEVDRRRRNRLVDVTATDASAVSTVPVTLDDH